VNVAAAAMGGTERSGGAPAGLASARVGGVIVELHPSGALWLSATRTLVVADLHFEKASSFARFGQLLPPYDTAITLSRLEAVVAALAPDRVVALGDSFHDRGGAARLSAADLSRLSALVGGREWLWVTGNHDPEISDHLGGARAADVEIGGLVLRHEPSATFVEGEVCGHLHPALTVVGRGRGVRRRCFATDGHRLVLPAFGSLAGGLDLFDQAFARVLSRARTVAHLIGSERLYRIPLTAARGR
jgi:DNA ligase-associated metallophosphoesterase